MNDYDWKWSLVGRCKGLRPQKDLKVKKRNFYLSEQV